MPQNPTEGPDTLIGDPNRVDNLEGLGGDDFILNPRNKPGVSPSFEFMNGGAGDDVLISYEDVIALGGTGDDQIFGSDLGDIIDGGEDDDLIAGGEGDDELIGGSGTDTVSYANANGVIINLLEGTSSGDHGNDTLVGFENIDGSKGADIIFGDDENNVIHGLGSRDVINGLGGNDEIYGDKGDDTLAGGEGNDELYGGTGHDQLVGGDGIDQMFGGNGNDLLNGGSGADIIDGGNGARDTASFIDNTAAVDVDLVEGTATSTFNMAVEVDSLRNIEDIIGSAFDDTLAGDDGNNVIAGGDGKDTITGRDGDDILTGGAGGDDLLGNEGDDFILGLDGEDFIVGGDGSDGLFGGAALEADTFHWFGGNVQLDEAWRDVIFDFQLGTDILSFSDFFSDDIFEPGELTATVSNGNTILIADLSGTAAAQGQDVFFSDFVVLQGVELDNNDLADMVTNGTIVIV